MKTEHIRACGEALYEALKQNKPMKRPTVLYPDEIDIPTSYEIQKVMISLMEANGRHCSGKKIGVTSKAMRDLVHISEPDYGKLFFEDCYHSNSEIEIEKYIYPRVEAEILFKLKSDLNKPDVTFEDVVNATEYIVPAFELIDNRYEIEGQLITDSIADNAAFGAYIVADSPRYFESMEHARNLAYHGIVLEKNGRQIDTSTCAAVMGNPVNSVAWLANTMYRNGDPLLAGDQVLSGSIIAAVEVAKGDYFRCDYGVLGHVSVHFV